MQRIQLIVSVAALAGIAAAAFLARGGLAGDGPRYAAGAFLGGFAGFCGVETG